MRPNVKQFIELLAQAIDLPQPIVDIGALRTPGQEDYADLRPYFPPGGYTGWDMRAGPGVDAIGSVHHLPIAPGSAGTVLMLDTLEHVLDPLKSMQEVCRAVRPGGVVVITSHMNFPIHAHPSDYWRFTPMAFEHLIAPLSPRFVFIQGDSENPHNVMAVGMSPSPDPAAPDDLSAAIHRVEQQWHDDSYGGPLVRYVPVAMDVGQRDGPRDLPELVQRRTIEQRFTCHADGLCRIDVKMSNRVGLNTRHILFTVAPEDQPDHVLAAHRVYAWHVVDDGWLAVTLPPQIDSAGRRYVLTIESPDGIPGQAVSAKAGDASPPDAALCIDGAPVEGALCFQTYVRAPAHVEGDVQATEDTLTRNTAPPARNVVSAGLPDARLAAISEQQWEQTRFLAAALGARLDSIEETLRAHHADTIDLQRQTLHASTEKVLARSFHDNPAVRALRRFRKSGRTGG